MNRHTPTTCCVKRVFEDYQLVKNNLQKGRPVIKSECSIPDS